MEDKVYIVTLYKHEDLEQFYNEMQLSNFPLVLKRPLSRNTHYMMNEEQAERLRQDPRVWSVSLRPEEMGMTPVRTNTNFVEYPITGNFWKDDTIAPATISPGDLQWGHIHCAGNSAQRDKGQFGSGATYESKNDTVTVFNEGRHVDVVIVDDPVSYDCTEWESPSNPGQTRFVQYDWFNELNTYVSSIDDDGVTLPTGAVTYYTNATNPIFHGVHVTGTVAGQHYGWAREANIYALQILGTMPSGQTLDPLLLFDYLRAFHRYKAINPATGRRNPTITNHSWGYSYGTTLDEEFPGGLTPSDITNIFYNGVNYNSGNPGPSGWTSAGIEADFGIGLNKTDIPADYAALEADAEDAIRDGVVVIAAAGNSNYHAVRHTDPEYNNTVSLQGFGTILFNRGMAPGNAVGSVCVGALNKDADFTRATYTNFGPRVDVFAPGTNVLSSWVDPANITGNLAGQGIADSKYGGSNWFYPISGTSMASPQVAGVAACLATGKERFTNEDVLSYLQKTSILDDMTFNQGTGDFADITCRKDSPNSYLHAENPRPAAGFILQQSGVRNAGMVYPRVKNYFQAIYTPPPAPQTINITVSNSGSTNYTLSGDVTGNNATVNCNAGDTLVFSFNISGSHPFWIKTAQVTGTGSGVTEGTITNNGQQTLDLTWNTTGVTPGTYYYICQFHSGMNGQIIVS